MEIFLVIFFFILGASWGSFLNVVIDRLPQGRSLIRPQSSCSFCHRKLAPRDMVPVLSFLWLRGRCRYCGTPITWRVFWVELVTGTVFALACWYYGLSAGLGVFLFVFSLFLVIFVIDLEYQLVLNKVVYPASAVAIILAVFMPGLELVPDIKSAAIGGGLALGVFLVIVFASRGGMGWGDVKLAALIGLLTGFPYVLVAIFLAVFTGGIAAAVLLLTRSKGRRDAVPFGPFLSAAALVTVIWGPQMLNWYLGIFAI